ncbi:MAG: L-serine ammonia-lyase, iron-sulfur-dependent, subunit alpha [Fusobacteriaceae bacterium]|jgi:L-serine dehydratase|nr:L-serine ammonia-lyase, iron-sulfur-dependent, subunit alpha [Fusobacteriaceae bacterium]
MDSLRELFKIGNGPSSSHTIGPERAAKKFKEKHPNIKNFKVELYGSLALTGKGHLTDYIIIETLKPAHTEVIFMPEFVHPYHTNGMKFCALDASNNVMDSWLVFSIGGGTIMEEGEPRRNSKKVYPLNNFTDIKKWCENENKEYWEFVIKYEGEEIFSYLKEIWNVMSLSVKNGIEKTGILPGSLRLKRRANSFYKKSRNLESETSFLGKIFAYTLAVAEENGSGGRVVTAPTCGASGVIPGLLYALAEAYKLPEKELFKGLAIAGIVGNVIKENATISGAEGGCQAEIGSACAMAASMACFLLGGTLDQIEYAAEMALEHHLGLTCDPIGGYVQIPCIERNAAAAARALDSAIYCLFTDGKHTVSFDKVVHTMSETGKDLKSEYKETSLGGLAKSHYNINC